MVVFPERATSEVFGVYFGKRTIASCMRVQQEALGDYRAVLVRQYPHLAEDINKAGEAVITSEPTLPPSEFATLSGKIVIATSHGRFLDVPLIGQVLHHINPNLGVFEYLAFLVSTNTKRTDLPPFEKRYPWNGRLEHVQQAGGFSQDSPVLQFMAVAFAGQAAINIANEEGQRLVNTSESVTAVAGLEDYQKIYNFFESRLFSIRRHQAFLKACSQTLAEIVQRGQFTQDRQQLLLDLAFIHKDGLEKESEFYDFFKPIVQLVAKDGWQEAEACRDFLLYCFPGLFPNWRQRESGVEPAERSARSIDQLAGQIAAGEVMPRETPPAYEFLKDRLPQGLERAQRQREIEILRSDVSLSNAFVRELAREVAKTNLPANLPSILIRYFPHKVPDELLDFQFLGNGSRDLERWETLITEAYPRVPKASLVPLFDYLQKRINPPFHLRTSEGPVIILRPIAFREGRNISAQIYFDEHQEELDFGGLLKVIIETSLKEPGTRRLALGKKEVLRGLQRAYNLEKNKLNVSLEEYLRILTGVRENGVISALFAQEADS